MGRSAQPGFTRAIARYPLIVAPQGCIYRKRAIDCLEQAGFSWRIVYTIPDLAGIQAAIEEGLGITVLAKSTVPDNLLPLRAGDRLPGLDKGPDKIELGQIGVSLLYQDTAGDAATRLVDYVKASL